MFFSLWLTDWQFRHDAVLRLMFSFFFLFFLLFLAGQAVEQIVDPPVILDQMHILTPL